MHRLKVLESQTDAIRWISLGSADSTDTVRISVGSAVVEVSHQTDRQLLSEVLGILMAHVS